MDFILKRSIVPDTGSHFSRLCRTCCEHTQDKVRVIAESQTACLSFRLYRKIYVAGKKRTMSKTELKEAKDMIAAVSVFDVSYAANIRVNTLLTLFLFYLFVCFRCR